MGCLRFAIAAFVPLTTGWLSAQTVPGLDPGKNQKDGNIEITVRALLGPRAGRMAQHFPTGYWAGARTLRSFVFIVQDQNATTQETLAVEFRAQDPTTGFPDWPGNPPASAPARAAVAQLGNLHAQSVVLDAAARTTRLTNLDVHRMPMGGGYSFAIDAAYPLTFGFFQPRLKVQNDGPGDLTVEFLSGSTVVGSFTVRERTTVSTDGSVGGTPTRVIRIRSANQNANGSNPTRGAWLAW